MSVKGLRRVHVLRHTREQTLTQVEGGHLAGADDTPHPEPHRAGGAGRRPGAGASGTGQALEPAYRGTSQTTVLTLYEKRYGGFGPTLAAEKLAERHGITLSDETLRRWLRKRGVDHFTRRKRPHRAWRERRAHVGELIQLDGSHHDWFEGRGSRCVLMAYIDDTNSWVPAP